MLMGEYFGKLAPKQKKSLDIILRNTERLDKIIVDFLEISRIEAARLKFEFIKKNLESYIEMLTSEMKEFFRAATTHRSKSHFLVQSLRSGKNWGKRIRCLSGVRK